MKILSVFKKVFLACALLAAVAGCSKEEEEEDNGFVKELIGRWTFQEMDIWLESSDHQLFYAKESGIDLSEMNAAHRGLTVTFNKNKEISFDRNGRSVSVEAQAISDDEIFVRGGEIFDSFYYYISGNTLELGIMGNLLKKLGGYVSDEIEAIDPYPMPIILFTKDVQ
jgi:hypothetical protein